MYTERWSSLSLACGAGTRPPTHPSTLYSSRGMEAVRSVVGDGRAPDCTTLPHIPLGLSLGLPVSTSTLDDSVAEYSDSGTDVQPLGPLHCSDWRRGLGVNDEVDSVVSHVCLLPYPSTIRARFPWLEIFSYDAAAGQWFTPVVCGPSNTADPNCVARWSR